MQGFEPPQPASAVSTDHFRVVRILGTFPAAMKGKRTGRPGSACSGRWPCWRCILAKIVEAIWVDADNAFGQRLRPMPRRSEAAE